MPTSKIIPPGLVRQAGLGFTQVLPGNLARITGKAYYPEISGGVFQVPASGPTVVHGSGSINGYTSPAIPAQPPPQLVLDFYGNYYSTFVFTINTFGTNTNSTTFTAAGSDPGDGTTWIDTSAAGSIGDVTTLVTSSLAVTLPWLTSSSNNEFVYIDNPLAGAAEGLTGAIVNGPMSKSGGGYGVDYNPSSGSVDTTELYPAVIGKTLKVQSTSQKVFTFVAADVINWNGNISLTYHGYGDIFYFSPYGQSLTGNYSIDDLVASFGGVVDAAVLANGFPDVGISLDFSPAVSIDQDFPYGSATVTNINLTES